ncbi:MAG: hypothetical protein ACR2FN_03360 [Chitinophagaceae bacterium]
MNNSVQLVPIAPIPVTNSLINSYRNKAGNKIAVYFTLPFGMRSLALLDKSDIERKKRFKEDAISELKLKKQLQLMHCKILTEAIQPYFLLMQLNPKMN